VSFRGASWHQDRAWFARKSISAVGTAGPLPPDRRRWLSSSNTEPGKPGDPRRREARRVEQSEGRPEGNHAAMRLTRQRRGEDTLPDCGTGCGWEDPVMLVVELNRDTVRARPAPGGKPVSCANLSRSSEASRAMCRSVLSSPSVDRSGGLVFRRGLPEPGVQAKCRGVGHEVGADVTWHRGPPVADLEPHTASGM